MLGFFVACLGLRFSMTFHLTFYMYLYVPVFILLQVRLGLLICHLLINTCLRGRSYVLFVY